MTVPLNEVHHRIGGLVDETGPSSYYSTRGTPGRPGRFRAAPSLAMLLVLSAVVGIASGAFAPSTASAKTPTSRAKARPSPAASLHGSTVVYQYSAKPAPPSPGSAVSAAQVTGVVSSPGGPYLLDSLGRVVILHGVDAVYKHAPYELYPDPGRPWNFSPADAARIARLGFNVVRLGVEWEGLEPGSGAANSRSICTPGEPGNPHEFNASVARRYLANVAKMVDLLGRDGIYTLLDMHQDVYSHLFLGEGAPTWAVCTDNQPIVPVGGRWSRNYRNPTLDIAEEHFWDNDVVGNLQGQFDLVWATVARYFSHNPWVIGYDPYNEPFSMELSRTQRAAFATALECFYTGKAHPGALGNTTKAIACPATDPSSGLIPTIEAADPYHLIFVEPDIYSEHGLPALLGPMDFPHLVYNFHVYCPQRSPVTGNPTDVVACEKHELRAIVRDERERGVLSSARQPGGPAWFMSEFGATTNVALVSTVTKAADDFGLGWSYYSWKYYQDPTGSTSEALVTASDDYSPIVGALSRTYPQAIAGTPRSVNFNPLSGAFEMTYTPSDAGGPTSIFIAQDQHYPYGWCAAVLAGRIVSAPGALHLLVRPDGHASAVAVSVTAGRCPATK